MRSKGGFAFCQNDGRFLSVNCPLSVRELWPKGAEREQRDCVKSLINNGWLWACLYLYGSEFPLITQIPLNAAHVGRNGGPSLAILQIM